MKSPHKAVYASEKFNKNDYSDLSRAKGFIKDKIFMNTRPWDEINAALEEDETSCLSISNGLSLTLLRKRSALHDDV